MNVTALERDLAAKKTAIETLLAKQMTDAEKDKRERTDEEVAALETELTAARAIKARIDLAKRDETTSAAIAALTAGMTPTTPTPLERGPAGRKSLGQLFIESEAGEFLRKGGHRTQSAWRSPAIELPGIPGMYATTLDTSTGSGGKLIVPDYQAAILPLLFKRLVVADLIAPGTTDSNLITYMKETQFTNAADTVAEGAAKPESTLIFDNVSDPVRKIAHFLPVTEEMLEDVAQIQSYIDARLRLGIDLAEEDQLLNGSVVAPDIIGILNRTGLTAALPRGADTNADALFKQIMAIATTVFVNPTGIVLNPANWQTCQLTKNAAGNYMGSGPWAPAQPAQLWGLPVAVTPSIVAATGLVGDFRGSAQIFRKGGVRVEASNSHQDFFVKNLVAIRAEERLALAVYRPAAFGTVTGLN